MEHPGRKAWTAGRREQVALGLLAGVALLLIGRLALRPSVGGGPLLLATPTPGDLVVHVAGEVRIPGVYRLRAGSRWSDALAAARGPTFLADLGAVNLAHPLRDGDRVFFPRVPEPRLAAGGEPDNGEGPPPDRIRRGARPPSGRMTMAPAESGTAADGTQDAARALDVNAATAADLEALPGIGPVLAERIVAHREEHGRFERLEDLLEVEGIGPRLFARLKPLVQVR